MTHTVYIPDAAYDTIAAAHERLNDPTTDGDQSDVLNICTVTEIERKMARQLARRRERAIDEIREDVKAEIARHEERLAAEHTRHQEAITDYTRELDRYNNLTGGSRA